MQQNAEATTVTHVMLFPCPGQGHINSMLKLAQLLSLHHLNVTFLNTEHIHHRLLHFGHIEDLSATYPTLQFKTIPDGLPLNYNPRSGELFNYINLHAKPFLTEILLHAEPKVTCFIADAFFGGLATDVAHEVGIPIIHYLAVSASSFWAFFCVPKLFECNELPIRGEEDMDRIITSIPGMENLLRCRDLPSLCRQTDDNAVFPLKSIVSETQQTLRARALVLNTFEELEGPVLSQIRLKFPKVFTIGPVHAHLSSRTKTASSSNTETTPLASCLWEEDKSCMKWLDSQPLRSVIYVSFGSVAVVKREEVMEIWHGLVNSKKRFLWVIRPDTMVPGSKEGSTMELEEGTRERGLIVEWAPQEEVLAHWAVGGFLTHSGWNSTLESVVAGVPMVCWPCHGDQHTNSRFVSEVWGVGLDMKDVCDRDVVEKMVNDVMVHRREEFLRLAREMAELACKSVSPGGSSYSNLDHLIQYIKSIGQEN